jgi:hypothetical protein
LQTVLQIVVPTIAVQITVVLTTVELEVLEEIQEEFRVQDTYAKSLKSIIKKVQLYRKAGFFCFKKVNTYDVYFINRTY